MSLQPVTLALRASSKRLRSHSSNVVLTNRNIGPVPGPVLATRYFASRPNLDTPADTAKSTSELLGRLRRETKGTLEPDDATTTGTAAGVGPDGRGGLGPFPMGVGSGGRTGSGLGTPMGLGLGAGTRTKRWKKWKELGVGGKIGRTITQTGNLTVILVGGGLFLVLTYALTSELFATNSPTVLQNRAIDLINSSPGTKSLLLSPLAFTHSPNAQGTSSRGTPMLQTQLVRHPSTGHEHLVMRFWVHGRGIDEARGWRGWMRDTWEQGLDLGRQGLVQAGLLQAEDPEDDAGTASPPVTSASTQLETTTSAEPGWFSGIFGALSTSASGKAKAGLQTLGNKRKTLPPAGTYKMAEARADYVKDPDSEKYKLLTLTLDVPGGGSPTHRSVVFWADPVEVSHEGVLEGSMGRMRW